MLYNGLMNFAIVVACFIGIKAVADSFFSLSLFNGKATACVICGSFIGIFISEWMTKMSVKAGFFGMGLGIGIMFILVYTGLIRTIISLIPANIRKIIAKIINIIKVAIYVIIIIVIVYTVLKVLS